jgi:hypothetical protein
MDLRWDPGLKAVAYRWDWACSYLTPPTTYRCEECGTEYAVELVPKEAA